MANVPAEPNQVTTFLDDVIKLYELVTSNKLGSTLLFVGLLLILITCGLAYKLIRSKPEDTPKFLPGAFFACLGIGALLVITGPGVSWIDSIRGGIRKIPTAESFDNLKENSRVDWLMRLIAYNPNNQQVLAVSHLKKLGPEPQLFTFVSPYNELRGYNVSEAIRMVGGHIKPGEHVSAVIVKRTFDIIPANAKGMLQIVKDIQAERNGQLETSLDFSGLDQGDISNLKNRENRPAWSWEGYKKSYKHFCELATKFRCGDYSEKDQMSRIEEDWSPLGFARRIPPAQGACEKEMASVCNISEWSQAVQQFQGEFGARTFLVKNFRIKDLSSPYLIDFEQPDAQLIPDIGVADVKE